MQSVQTTYPTTTATQHSHTLPCACTADDKRIGPWLLDECRRLLHEAAHTGQEWAGALAGISAALLTPNAGTGPAADQAAKEAFEHAVETLQSASAVRATRYDVPKAALRLLTSCAERLGPELLGAWERVGALISIMVVMSTSTTVNMYV